MIPARPLVTVVVTNYNYGRFLTAALDSVLAQTYVPIEVIVVDDGSTDDSRSILERYSVKAIYQDNAGQAAALNAGVAAATGDIICLLDADDVWLPRKVERVVTALLDAPHVQWLRHPLEVVDADLMQTGLVVPTIGRSGPLPPSAAAVAERIITASTSAIAFRRSIAHAAFPLTLGSQLRLDADALVVARLGSACMGWQLDEVLGRYRRHEGQQYARAGDLRRMLERQIEVGTLIADALGRSEPVCNYKYRAILAELDQRASRNALLGGLKASLQLVGQPRVMARQTAALLYAALAPDLWLRKVRRKQGATTDAGPTPPRA